MAAKFPKEALARILAKDHAAPFAAFARAILDEHATFLNPEGADAANEENPTRLIA